MDRKKSPPPSPFDLEFKRLRNQLAKCDVESLVRAASVKLHVIDNHRLQEWEDWYPWRLLLLIKWAFEFGEQDYPPKQVDENFLIKLMNIVGELESIINPFLKEGTKQGAYKFLRTLSFQQFWLQGNSSRYDIARPYILFCKLPVDHPIQENFKRQMHISMSDFLDFSFLLWLCLKSEPNQIVFQPQRLFEKINYSESEFNAFWNAITLHKSNVKKHLCNRKKAIKNLSLQLTEETPFVRYPVLSLKDGYLIYSRRVFERTINTLFYDVMKEDDNGELSGSFGLEFEKYIAVGMKCVFDDYLSEADMRKCFPGGKVTDFLLALEDSIVMIEVKAAEMQPMVKVLPRKKELTGGLEDSVVKATIQGFTLANALKNERPDIPITPNTKFYLLIVTYRDMHLGPGENVWDEFLRDAVAPELQKEGIDQALIAPERIATLSVEEFDLLISVLLTKKITLLQILEKMVTDNADQNTRKFSFGQHLDGHLRELGITDPKLPYLSDAFDELKECALSRFKSRG